METFLNFADPFTWLFLLTVTIGTGMIIFGNAGWFLLGIFILFMNSLIMHDSYQQQSDIRYVYESFKQGKRIECGLWRGQQIIADPAQGWTLSGGRFISKDTVLTDPGLCSVMEEKSPQVSPVGPVIFFFVILGISLLARLGVRKQEGRAIWSGERIKKDSENNMEVKDEHP